MGSIRRRRTLGPAQSDMEYRNEGHDRTLVLVHGIAGEAAWQPLAGRLTERPELQEWDIHSFE